MDGVVYSAIKASVLTLTKSMAQLLAPEMTVNCMVLGAIDTTWVNWLTCSRVSVLKNSIPLKALRDPR